MEEVTNKTLAKAAFFKVLPLCLVVIGLVAALKSVIVEHLGYKINSMVFFVMGGAICSWLFSKYLSPINQKLMKNRGNSNENK